MSRTANQQGNRKGIEEAIAYQGHEAMVTFDQLYESLVQIEDVIVGAAFVIDRHTDALASRLTHEEQCVFSLLAESLRDMQDRIDLVCPVSGSPRCDVIGEGGDV